MGASNALAMHCVVALAAIHPSKNVYPKSLETNVMSFSSLDSFFIVGAVMWQHVKVRLFNRRLYQFSWSLISISGCTKASNKLCVSPFNSLLQHGTIRRKVH